jgi:hypothetical protein
MLDFGPHMRVPRFIRLKSSPISRRERNPLKQDFLRRALGQGVGRATNASLMGLFMLQLGRAEIEGNHFTAARSSRSIPRSYHIPGGGSENHRQNRWWESHRVLLLEPKQSSTDVLAALRLGQEIGCGAQHTNGDHEFRRCFPGGKIAHLARIPAEQALKLFAYGIPLDWVYQGNMANLPPHIRAKIRDERDRTPKS